MSSPRSRQRYHAELANSSRQPLPLRLLSCTASDSDKKNGPVGLCGLASGTRTENPIKQTRRAWGRGRNLHPRGGCSSQLFAAARGRADRFATRAPGREPAASAGCRRAAPTTPAPEARGLPQAPAVLRNGCSTGRRGRSRRAPLPQRSLTRSPNGVSEVPMCRRGRPAERGMNHREWMHEALMSRV